MMLLSDLAREHGVFDWLSSVALRSAGGSCSKLFALVYAVGTIVTIFMSNDATAVVLTPAILAAVRKAKVRPLPLPSSRTSKTTMSAPRVSRIVAVLISNQNLDSTHRLLNHLDSEYSYAQQVFGLKAEKNVGGSRLLSISTCEADLQCLL